MTIDPNSLELDSKIVLRKNQRSPLVTDASRPLLQEDQQRFTNLNYRNTQLNQISASHDGSLMPAIKGMHSRA